MLVTSDIATLPSAFEINALDTARSSVQSW